jgi:sialate O-acetylesterase
MPSIFAIRRLTVFISAPAVFLATFALCSARAEVILPSIFSEHMALQKANGVPVWGKAEPGEKVTVTLDGKTAHVTAGQDGKWRLALDLRDCGAGPFEMTVEGKNRIVIRDAVVGEVWLASGQSNMELPLRVTADADAEIAKSANPLLRQFAVKKTGANKPMEDCDGQWTVAGPATSGEFTAIGYYFGKELQQTRQQPVAIIHASNGGTFIEPWTPADALNQIEAFRAPIAAIQKATTEYPMAKAKFAKDFAAWLKAHDREDKPCQNLDDYAAVNTSTADWNTVNLPNKTPVDGFPSSGVFWLRHDIDVSAILAQQGFKIMIGPLAGYWQVYWNGKLLTETTYAQLPGKDFACYFAVLPEQILTGKNTLAIRIYSPTSPLIVRGGSLWAGPIVLDGAWLAKVESTFPDLPPDVLNSAPQMTYKQPDMMPGSLYNARIHPLTRYTIAGVLWYQGESNVSRAYQYRVAFPALIQGWREKWQRDGLPFYWCQVCNNNAKLSAPGESAWAELRESQSLALALPNTGQAMTIDLGEAGDLHFRDKKTAAHRLFLIAQARHYGKPVPCSGPVYESITIEDGKARIKFTSADGGLVAAKLPTTYSIKTLLNETAPLSRNSPESQLEGFAICGADHRWVWADAKIDETTVLVWSDKVPSPVAVRYAWADNPTCNLYNAAGLPAPPFRTDDFPTTTDKYGYGLSPQGKY